MGSISFIYLCIPSLISLLLGATFPTVEQITKTGAYTDVPKSHVPGLNPVFSKTTNSVTLPFPHAWNSRERIRV